MLRNMLIMTLRNIRQQKGIFLITLTGLATGLAAAFLLYVCDS